MTRQTPRTGRRTGMSGPSGCSARWEWPPPPPAPPGSAPCARWLAAAGARVVGLDLSSAMLRYAAAAGELTGIEVPLVRANAERLPFATGAFDLACSAFGAVPFV